MRKKQQDSSQQSTDNGPRAQENVEPAGYETIRDNYLEPTQVYEEIDEMTTSTRQNNKETNVANINPAEYQELDAAPSELARWREKVETGNTGPYQDLVKDNLMTEGDGSKQYYNMPDATQGKGSYSNVALHSE